MKLAVIGGRTFTDEKRLFEELDKYDNITEIISGYARGGDLHGKRYALMKGIKYTEYLPDWELHGKSAGIIRNRYIIDDSDEILAAHDGISKGTLFSINYAIKQGKKVNILNY